MTHASPTLKRTSRLDWRLALKRTLDIVLVVALIYAALLALGIVRRGSRFDQGHPAPPFTLSEPATNAAISLADLKGKPVLLNFFSTGCFACRRELPTIADFQARAGDRLQVLVISTDPTETMAAYLKQNDINLRTLHDPGQTHRAYGVDTIPYLVLIDSQGQIQADYIGGISWSDIEPWLAP